MATGQIMTDQADHLAELRFTGGIYDSCALDDRALQEIIKVMHAITETAKELWRTEHADRARAPKGFNESHQVHMREIRSGSTAVVLDPAVREDSQLPLMNGLLNDAVAFMHDSCVAVREDTEPPLGLTPTLVNTYAQLGSKLESSAALSFTPRGGARTRIDPFLRKQFRERIPDSYDGIVDLIGRVLAADVHRRTFQIWLGRTLHINADFSSEQENQITSALRDHDAMQLRIRGRGRYRITGDLIHIDQVERIDPLHPDDIELDPDEPMLSQMIERAFADVPAETWEALPQDMAERHDDYFSGAATF